MELGRSERLRVEDGLGFRAEGSGFRGLGVRV